MYKLMINHSTRDITFGEALCELLEKNLFSAKGFFHIDIELKKDKLKFKFFVKEDLEGYQYRYFYNSKLKKVFYISGCEDLFLKVPSSVTDDIHGYYTSTVKGSVTVNEINIYFQEKERTTKHERHKYDLSNEKNMIRKVVSYLSEVQSNKENIINASRSGLDTYKLNSGNIFYLKESPFINIHRLLDDYRSNFISNTNFYLMFLKQWDYFKGFDTRRFSFLRHYILPYGYIRVHCHGAFHDGEYYKRKEDSLYAYAIENFYKNRNSLYDTNEYGKVAWVLIEKLLQYLSTYKNNQLDNLILDMNAFASKLYRRIESTEEINMIHKYTYNERPKNESQLIDKCEYLNAESKLLDEWKKDMIYGKQISNGMNYLNEKDFNNNI